MSTHNSLCSNRFSTSVIDRSHPGQRRGSANKRARRALRQARDAAEAIALGISVEALLFRRYQKAQATMKAQRQQAVALERTLLARETERRRRWGY